MKRLLIILVLCLSGIATMKGEHLVATLQAGDATKVFYGQSAFVEAYAEASEGDVITLSKGNFKEVTIEKTITLRGAGAFVEGESTVFESLTVNADCTVVEGIQVTGTLLIHGNKQQLLRCNIETLNSKGERSETFTPSTTDIYIADCAIKCDGHAFDCVNAVYKNCLINRQAGNFYSEGSATYDHCIVRITGCDVGTNNGGRCGMYRYGYFYNCILHREGPDSSSQCGGLRILVPNQFYNTIIYSCYSIEFESGVQRSNCITSKIGKSEYDNKFGSSKFPYFFAEEGTAPDVVPFVCGVVYHKEWPAIPRVVESNIDRETDAAGHLKVDIKVSCEK